VATIGASCDGSDHLCAPAGDVCLIDTCVTPAAEGQACIPTCQPGQTYCGNGMTECIAALQLGEPCAYPLQCASKHCGTSPVDPFGPTVCRPPLEVFEDCDPVVGICPIATFCLGPPGDQKCVPQGDVGDLCETNADCFSGQCGSAPGIEGLVCLGSGICHVTWQDAP
jgi:hypothetical protein